MIESEESEELEESDKSQRNKDKEISAYTEGEEFYPASVEIGSIIKTQFSWLEAWTKSAINGINFESVNDAISYLLRKANIDLKETAQAYEYAQL